MDTNADSGDKTKEQLEYELKQPWIVEDREQVPEELRDLLTKQRHGFGIQIYSDGKSRYAGDWQFNKKTGEGHMVYMDGSEYKGKICDGQRHGYGYFKWPAAKKSVNPEEEEAECKDKQTGHVYVGQWRYD